MEEMSQLATGFKKRFYKFVSQYKQAIEENKQLKSENERIKADLDYKSREVEKLVGLQKKEDLKNAFLASDYDVKKAKQNISKIVREIDHCIALLNR